MHNSLKAPTIDPSVCPGCGKRNECAQSIDSASERSVEEPKRCWCMEYPPAEVEHTLTKGSCLCESCLKQRVSSLADGEMAP